MILLEINLWLLKKLSIVRLNRVELKQNHEENYLDLDWVTMLKVLLLLAKSGLKLVFWKMVLLPFLWVQLIKGKDMRPCILKLFVTDLKSVQVILKLLKVILEHLRQGQVQEGRKFQA